MTRDSLGIIHNTSHNQKMFSVRIPTILRLHTILCNVTLVPTSEAEVVWGENVKCYKSVSRSISSNVPCTLAQVTVNVN